MPPVKRMMKKFNRDLVRIKKIKVNVGFDTQKMNHYLIVQKGSNLCFLAFDSFMKAPDMS